MKFHRAKKFIVRFGLALVFCLGASAAAVVADGLSDRLGRADAAVVLGNEVLRNGQPSKRLQARLDKAAALFHAGLFGTIIVSGGVGAAGFDEADVMKSYLVSQGVPAAQVITDSKGSNTLLTARNASKIMRGQGFSSAIVISQYFHITRSRVFLKDAGVPVVYSAHADYVELRDLYSTFREVVALGVYFLTPT